MWIRRKKGKEKGEQKTRGMREKVVEEGVKPVLESASARVQEAVTAVRARAHDAPQKDNPPPPPPAIKVEEPVDPLKMDIDDEEMEYEPDRLNLEVWCPST